MRSATDYSQAEKTEEKMMPTVTVVRQSAGDSADVKSHYDRVGWKETSAGVAEDTVRFGVRENGPIRSAAHLRRLDRIRTMLHNAGEHHTIIECGCGGNPALSIAGEFKKYIGMDFSTSGLAMAKQRAEAAQGKTHSLQTQFIETNLTSLPLKDSSVDAVYTAHVLYHIPLADGQRQALQEMMRVLKPGGVAVIIVANPTPLLFPIRALRRITAAIPGIRQLADALRKSPPLPYLPLSIGWMKRTLRPYGHVDVSAYAVPSIWFNQHVSERGLIGRLLWKLLDWIERSFPRASARLGNFVMYTVRRSSH
ncbi:MAG TPA: class I SAM-dependent methyltransferase [Phycisphaerales bacterium]|nr:class I SAM-dependent methyltransferase [Phycisphaerales bacterium]